ncbi:MAG TPA: CoA pyrophosphatase [Thermotogota bacterium]|nr:CoA pyrophosphatase [Thermotogota bacterium]
MPFSSAVLVGIWKTRSVRVLVLTQRNRRLREHPGEISFSGGKCLPGENPVATALREAREEMGVEQAQLLSLLPPEQTVNSGHLILPVVARLHQASFRCNAEVERLHFLPLPLLFRSHEKWETFLFREKPIRVPVWDFKAFVVWGATGRMLVHFQKLFRQG